MTWADFSFDTFDTRGYRDLRVWRVGMELAEKVLKILASRSLSDYLAQQLIARSMDVPTYIAEGYAGGSIDGFTKMVRAAKSSLAAFDTQLNLAATAHYFPESILQDLNTLLTRLDIYLAQLSVTLEKNNREPSSIHEKNSNCHRV